MILTYTLKSLWVLKYVDNKRAGALVSENQLLYFPHIIRQRPENPAKTSTLDV